MSETDYGSRLPGQLALWQVGKAGKPLRDRSIADPVRVVDFRRVNSRPGLHRGYVPGTIMSGNGHGLKGQLALLEGGQSNHGSSSRETLA
jgi:hypothetical protein